MRRVVAPVLLVLLAGCGVPQDSAPRMLDSPSLPFALPGSSPAPVPDDQTAATADGQQLALFFVRDGQLEQTVRPSTTTASLPALITALLGGPTIGELESGLSSVIPASLTVEDVTLEQETAVIELGGPQEQVSSAQPLAFAQIVTTLTASPRVTGVRFRLDEEDLSVPRGDGLLSDAPLRRSDYLDLIGVPPT